MAEINVSLPVRATVLSPGRARAAPRALMRSYYLPAALVCAAFVLIAWCCYQQEGSVVQVQSKEQLSSRRLSSSQILGAIEKQHPINRLQCGTWMQQYMQLHQNILAGRAPQRYAVFRSRPEFGNGLADRLATSVTIFMYALLTNRAFLFDWDPPPLPIDEAEALKGRCGPVKGYEPPSPLWHGLKSDFIDWRYNGQDAGRSSIVMDYNCDTDTDTYKQMFAAQDITKLHDERESVIWYADRASVWAAFDNPHLKDRLMELGLRQDTAFACLFDFLYRPTPEVVQLFQPELQVLLDPDTVKIGVQIRVGDWQLCDSYMFKPQHYPSLFDHYFWCAREIEQEVAAPGQHVVYYTLTDIPELRGRLAKRHGARILTNTGVQVEHIVKTANGSEDGFLTAVGELWLFSLTDAQVITRISGFGKVPAMLSANGRRHIFSIDYPMVFAGTVGLDNRKNVGWYHGRRCTAKNATPLDRLSRDFTGI